MRPVRYISVLLLALPAILPSARLARAAKASREYLVYFGTYTDKGSKGIYACRFRPATGKLSPVELAAEAVNPSFLAVDPTQHYLFAANEIGDYGNVKSGSVSSFAIDRRSGKLRALNTVASRGAGPRHIALHPNGRWAYVISEMGNTITAFDWDADKGSFHELQTISTLPKDFTGENTTAEVAVHPKGRYLYGSNRGHDSIAVYAIDPAKGMLTLIEDVPTLGKEPRNFALDPTGAYLFAANQNSNTVVVFRVNSRNGRLTPSGEKVEVISPVCVTFVAAQ